MPDKNIEIGFINIMPNKKETEGLLMGVFKNILDKIKVYPIRLESDHYNQRVLARDTYMTFQEIIKYKKLDLLIISGAPVEKLEYKQVTYWNELCKIIDYAKENFHSVLGVCYGGLVLAKLIGINKKNLKHKLFGVYNFDICDLDNIYFNGKENTFTMPVSTWSILDKKEVACKINKTIRGLVFHKDFGYLMLETLDGKFLMVLGHPEYGADILQREWERDVKQGLNYSDDFDRQYFKKIRKVMAEEKKNPIEQWVVNCMNKTV